MAKEVITLKDSFSQDVLQHAINREMRVLHLSVTQIQTKDPRENNLTNLASNLRAIFERASIENPSP